jgi:hypothetical protein
MGSMLSTSKAVARLAEGVVKTAWPSPSRMKSSSRFCGVAGVGRRPVTLGWHPSAVRSVAESLELFRLKCVDHLYKRHDLNALQTEQPNGLSGNVPMKPPDSGLIKRTSHEGESRDTITSTFLQHRHK